MTERQKKSVKIVCEALAKYQDELTPVEKAALENLTTGAPARDTFAEMFGEGDKISALDCFIKYNRGPAEMKRCIKAWAKRGIVVELEGGDYVLKKRVVGGTQEGVDGEINVEIDDNPAPKAEPKKVAPAKKAKAK